MSSDAVATNNNKLKAKDFIIVGIFTAIIFVVEFACGMLGYIHPFIVASYVIMIALVGAIPMMLFDEQTPGLDYSHMKKVGQLLKTLASSGNTVLVATHDPELIELCCDYVLCIENGKLGYMKRV